MQRFACYDFNYAVLTTRASFSYGNLLPCVMQEHGAVLIGEPTGGGSCSVQMSVLTGGGGILHVQRQLDPAERGR